MKKFIWTLALLACSSFLVAEHAQAQTMPMTTTSSETVEEVDIVPEEMTPEAINAMVARMSDDEVRNLLLDRLDAVAQKGEVVEDPATFVEKMAGLWAAFVAPTVTAIKVLPNLIPSQMDAFSNFASFYGGASGVLTLFGLMALALAIAFGAEFGVRTWFIKVRNPDASDSGKSLLDAVRFLLRRFLREIFGLVVFYIVLRLVGRAILSPEQIIFASPFVGYLIWMPRLAAAFSRFMMAPNRSDLRLVNVDDHWAKFIHRCIVCVVFLGGLMIFVVQFNGANGVPPGKSLIGYWINMLVYLNIAYMCWYARDGLSDMMRGTDPDNTRFDEMVARSYPYFGIAVVVATWVVVSILAGMGIFKQILQGAHYTTMFLLLFTPAIDTAIRGLVRHLVPPMLGEGEVAEQAYVATKRSYVRIGRVIAVGIVLALIARAWDFNSFDLLQDRAGVADNLFSFLMTVIVGYIAYEGVSLWINRRLAAEMTALGMSQEDADNEMGGGGGSRLSTVLPLALVSAQTTIIVIFGLLAVGNLGIDITPLLAGAGIAGLAIGFGAQKLVTDVVSGIFFLVDDAFRTGEYVEIDGTMGAVEKISIRSMQLRHHRGPVHTIPYGEIPKLTNYSRDWVIMKLKFTVPFDTDPNKVKKIFKKIGQEMLQDELFKDDFLQPFKSQGVFDIDDVGMVIRGKFMAKPGKQFMIRKEIYNKVKSAFKENGIDFARREVRVALPDMEHHEEMTEAEKTALSAAAAAAAQQQDEQGPASAPKGPD
ncbi:mechanosensitive ion channel family protein [Shimia abyssi]|uniref:Small-conductance mechanosensitive channel n=1 Tax=Shimia abyssi TaxID=1662395 RepID=A0A2P8FG10_9RHOB|nr:mechanosensitive ion channel family protein [Shimia abyssi]PSL20644.1 small-conductance mechanosensitive channel [Shimia abyssi]